MDTDLKTRRDANYTNFREGEGPVDGGVKIPKQGGLKIQRA